MAVLSKSETGQPEKHENRTAGDQQRNACTQHLGEALQAALEALLYFGEQSALPCTPSLSTLCTAFFKSRSAASKCCVAILMTTFPDLTLSPLVPLAAETI